jgi:hypothetical protein
VRHGRDAGVEFQPPFHFLEGGLELRAERRASGGRAGRWRGVTIHLEPQREVVFGAKRVVARRARNGIGVPANRHDRHQKENRHRDLADDHGGPDATEAQARSGRARAFQPRLHLRSGRFQRRNDPDDGRGQQREQPGVDPRRR